jgi:hypothetical protein
MIGSTEVKIWAYLFKDREMKTSGKFVYVSTNVSFLDEFRLYAHTVLLPAKEPKVPVKLEGGLQVCGKEKVRISASTGCRSRFLGNEDSSIGTIQIELS